MPEQGWVARISLRRCARVVWRSLNRSHIVVAWRFLAVGLFGIAVTLGTLGRAWSGAANLLSHLDSWGTAFPK